MTAWVLVLIFQSANRGGMTAIEVETYAQCVSMGDQYVQATGGTSSWSRNGSYTCLNRSNK